MPPLLRQLVQLGTPHSTATKFQKERKSCDQFSCAQTNCLATRFSDTDSMINFSYSLVTFPTELRSGKWSKFWYCFYRCSHFSTNDFDFSIYLIVAEFDVWGPFEFVERNIASKQFAFVSLIPIMIAIFLPKRERQRPPTYYINSHCLTWLTVGWYYIFAHKI